MDRLYQQGTDHFRAPRKTGANQKILYIYRAIFQPPPQPSPTRGREFEKGINIV
jgi:hypothetical protein